MAYEQIKKEAFESFTINLHKLKFTEEIKRIDGHRHHVLVGNISTGKTSLINYACGTKLPVAMGECTSQVQEVAKSKKDTNLHIWDSPGVNDHFKLFDHRNLSYFYCTDRIFIVYPDSVKNCKEMIVVLVKIKPNDTFLVRSQCDRWNQSHTKTIEQEILNDKKDLASWGVNVPVLATSALKPDAFYDNAKFKRLLSGI